jgi:fibronectin-binding autotransporter adhesin
MAIDRPPIFNLTGCWQRSKESQMKTCDSKSRNNGVIALVAFMVLAVALPSVQAASYTWTGGPSSSDPAWTTTANWGGSAPSNPGSSNDVFTITTSGRDVSDIVGTSGTTSGDGRYLNQLIFDAGTTNDFLIRTTAAWDGNARQLNFRNSNPAITVQAGSAGNLTIGSPTKGNVYLGNTLTVTHNGDGTLTVQRPISGAAGAGITKDGSGQLILSAANTYTGLTDIQAGTLQYGAANVIVDAASIKVSGGTLNIASYSDTVAGVQLTSGAITGTSGTLTSSSAFDMQAGTVSAELGGAIALNKTTGGTVILSGANTYSGLTTVGAGTLLVNNTTGSGTGTGAVTVDSGATLGGSGIITGSVTNNGTITGGTDGAVGTLATGAITLNSGSTLKVDMDGATTDLLASTGAVTIEAGAQLDFNATAVSLGTYTLMTYSSRSGSFSVTGLPAGYVLNYDDTALTLDKDLGAVSDGSWNVDASGLWDTDSNWAASTVANGPNQTATFNNDITGDRTVTLDSERYIGNIVFEDGNTGTAGGWTIAGNGNVLNVSLGSITVNALGTGKAAEIGADIDGGNGLTKAGSGKLILSGANTYTGNTTINAGTLAVSGGNNRLPTGTTVEFTGTATFEVDANNQILSEVTLVDGVTGTINGGGSLTLTGATFMVGGASTTTAASQSLNLTGLNSFVYTNSSGTFAVGGNQTSGSGFSTGTVSLPNSTTILASQLRIGATSRGNITGTSTMGGDSGTLTLGNATLVKSNSIQLGNNQSNGEISAGAANATLTLRNTDGISPVASMIIGTSAGVYVYTSSSLLDLSSGTLDASIATLTLGRYNRTTTSHSNSHIQKGELKMGGGTLDAETITIGQNIASVSVGSGSSADGILTVSNGTAKVRYLYVGGQGSSSANNAVTGIFNLNGGANLYAQTIDKGPGTGSQTATRTFNWNDGTIHNYDSSTDLTINNNFDTFVLNGAAAAHVFEIDSGRQGTVNQLMSGTGGIAKSGTGSLTLSAENTYNGGTTVTEGTLNLGADNPLGGGTLAMNGGVLGTSGGARVLTNAVNLQAASTTVDTTGGNLTLSGSITNSGALVKIGAGMLTLSGVNTYAGETTVSNGTLAITGSSTLSDSAALRIASGATVDLAVGVTETVYALYFGTARRAAGVWGTTASGAPNTDDVYFSGTGTIEVLSGEPGGSVFKFR